MGEWKECFLGDLCNIFTGKKDVNQTVDNGKYLFFSCAPKPFKSNDYIYDGKAIIVAGNGSYTGRVSKYCGKFDLYQRTYACTPKSEDFNLDFVYWYMKSFFERNYLGGTRGSSIPYIVKNDLASFTINLPSLKEQELIASILSSLDEKIETNRAINKRLGELAAAIFKSWFIDFEPFADGELKRWKIYKLEEIADIISGGTPKTDVSEYWNGDIPWISVKDIVSVTKFVNSTEKAITELGLNNSATNILHPGDFIISARGTVGAIACVAKDMAFNQSCFGIHAKDSIFTRWLYYAIKFKIKDLQSRSQGSVFDTIIKKTLLELQILQPDINVIMKFDKIIASLDAEILKRQREIDILASLRDALLPRLMSGELIPE